MTKRKRDLYYNCPIVKHTRVPTNLNTIIRTSVELCAHETRRQNYSIFTTRVLTSQICNLHWSLLTTRTFYNTYRSECFHYVYTCYKHLFFTTAHPRYSLAKLRNFHHTHAQLTRTHSTSIAITSSSDAQLPKCLNSGRAEIRGTNSILHVVIAHREMGGESCHVGVERVHHFLNGNA